MGVLSHRFTPLLTVVAIVVAERVTAQERLISYDTDHRVPEAVNIQAGVQRGDTSVVVWGTYSYSSDWQMRFHLVAQALHDTVQIGSRTTVTDTSCVPSYFVAVAPVADRFLVIWTDSRESSPGLYGRIVTAMAAPIGDPFLLVSGATTRREHVQFVSGSNSLLLFHRPQSGDTSGIDLLKVDRNGSFTRRWLAGTSLLDVQPLGALPGVLICGADSCQLLDGDGVLSSWSMPRMPRSARYCIEPDSSWMVVSDSTLYEYASLRSAVPDRIRHIRGPVREAQLVPARDSTGALRILQCHHHTDIWWEGPCVVATDVDPDEDTVRLTGRDTLWTDRISAAPYSGENSRGTYRDITLHRLPRNATMIRARYTIDRGFRGGGSITSSLDRTRVILDARTIVTPRWVAERPDFWAQGVTPLRVERLLRRAASTVRVWLTDTVELEEPLEEVGNFDHASFPNAFGSPSGVSVSWLSGAGTLRACLFNRGPRAVGFARSHNVSNRARRWGTPEGDLISLETNAEPPPGKAQQLLFWADDQVLSLYEAFTYFTTVRNGAGYDPDARVMRAWIGSTMGGSNHEMREYSVTDSRGQLQETRFTGTRERPRGDLPLGLTQWVVLTDGRPTALRSITGVTRQLFSTLQPRPGAHSMRVTGGRLLQSWWNNEWNAWVVERLAIDTVTDAVARTDSISLPYLPPSPPPVYVEDPRSGEVFVLSAQDSIMLGSLSDAFKARKPYRIAPGAVRPSNVAGVVVGDTLYVVWTDRRAELSTIWGIPIALTSISRVDVAPERPEEHEPPVLPLPADDLVRIVCSPTSDSWISCTLYGADGAVVASVSIAAAPGLEALVTLDVSHLPNGVYVARLRRGEAVGFTRVVVVHR